MFEFATGEFVGTQHLLRPDIYLNGTPPCPQQPGGEYGLCPAKRSLGLLAPEVSAVGAWLEGGGSAAPFGLAERPVAQSVAA